MVERGELTEGHARAVLAVPDNEGRRRLARKIVAPGAVGARRRARGALGRRRDEAAEGGRRRPGARRARRSRGRAADRVPRRGSARAGSRSRSTTRSSSRSSPKRSSERRRLASCTCEWVEDLESLEAISQDDEARQIFSRMAAMSQEGRLGTFLVELRGDAGARRLHEGDAERDRTATRRFSWRWTTTCAARTFCTSRCTWPRRCSALAAALTDASLSAPIEVVMARAAGRTSSGEWAIVDSNHGPPPYQSGALTN